MVERFIAPVLKTGDPQGSVGSNPTPSANSTPRRASLSYCCRHLDPGPEASGSVGNRHGNHFRRGNPHPTHLRYPKGRGVLLGIPRLLCRLGPPLRSGCAALSAGFARQSSPASERASRRRQPRRQDSRDDARRGGIPPGNQCKRLSPHEARPADTTLLQGERSLVVPSSTTTSTILAGTPPLDKAAIMGWQLSGQDPRALENRLRLA
jgi:hypothetical protein